MGSTPRQRAGVRVFTWLTEDIANFLINWCMNKCRQVQW
jgi:hypothetical protein